MIKTIQANAIYIKSNHGKSKNYIKNINISSDSEANIEFTQKLSDVRPFEDSEIQEAMKLLATPFISNLMSKGKTEQEILSWTQENIGSDSIDITISTGEELE